MPSTDDDDAKASPTPPSSGPSLTSGCPSRCLRDRRCHPTRRRLRRSAYTAACLPRSARLLDRRAGPLLVVVRWGVRVQDLCTTDGDWDVDPSAARVAFVLGFYLHPSSSYGVRRTMGPKISSRGSGDPRANCRATMPLLSSLVQCGHDGLCVGQTNYPCFMHLL